jgi:hypothetical protein
MKRLILAASIALSTSAFADKGQPFEQTELDRALPQIEFAAGAPYHAGSNAPYEELVIDRMLPNLPTKASQYAAVDTGTRVDASSDTTESPWAKDYNFIAPPG